MQRKRVWPTRVIRAFGALALRGIGRQLRIGPARGLPRILPLVTRLPVVGRLLARFVAFGLWRVHVEGAESVRGPATTAPPIAPGLAGKP